jgi:hypothetical protein
VLTLHRLPRAYRILYVGIALLLVAALLSHWVRLALRHGWSPAEVAAWYRGSEADMLFPKPPLEVAEDAWANLFHHTLAFLVLGGLLVRADACPGAKACLGAAFGAATIASAAGPPLVWWGVPGAAVFYLGALLVLSGVALGVAAFVVRDAVARRAGGHRGIQGSDVLARAQPVLLLLVMALARPAEAQAGVFLSEGAAIAEVFPGARQIGTDTVRPDSAARAELEQRLGRPLFEPFYVLRDVYGAGPRAPLLGHALLTEERGKYRPITFLVGVDTALRVAGVRVLVYREPRGGEVARQYFLRQYQGKGVGDPIRLNRDIINISGATISVHSLNAGVRKTLALLAWRRAAVERRPPPAILAPLEDLL